MAASVYDIAREAGVSRTTVLRALWNRDRIDPATKARVLRVAAELNYRPNLLARSLVTGKSRFVGVLSGLFEGHVYNGYISPIYSILRDAGYLVLFQCVGTGESENSWACVNDVISSRASAVLALPSVNNADPAPYRQLAEAEIPLIVMDRVIEGLEAPQIVSNQYRIGRVAADHLLSLGHRRIAHLCMPGDTYMGRERMRGYTEALAEAGVPLDESLVIEVEHSVRAGAAAMRELLKLGSKRPTAVVARLDYVAVGAIAVTMEAGLSVPRDMSFVGNGDVPLADMLRVPLTTFTSATVEVASTSTRYLLDMLSGKPLKPDVYSIDTELVLRESTAPAP